MPVVLVIPNNFGSQAGPTIPVAQIDDDFAAVVTAINGVVPTLTEFNAAKTPRGYLSGLGLANNAVDPTNDIDIAIGTARDSTNVNTLPLASAFTKQLDAAWALGTAAGMRDTGAISNATWHLFLIMRVDTLNVDVLASLSATAPTMPANYTLFRRIGSIVRSAGAILTFVQVANYFRWKASVADVAVPNPGAGAVTRVLTVPTGIQVEALVSGAVNQAANTINVAMLLSDLGANDEVPVIGGLGQVSVSAGGLAALTGAWQGTIMTDVAASIRSRLSNSDANTTLNIRTLGWYDTRGQG